MGLPGDLGDGHGEALGRRSDLVVDDHVVELPHRLELHAAGRQPGGDLALGVRCAPLEAPAQLGERGRRDEDRGRLGHVAADGARAGQLDLDQRGSAGGEDAVDLGAERAVAVARVLDVLEEGPLAGAALELLRVEEVVLDAVDLARPLAPGGGRDRDLDVREAGKDALDERPLPRTRRSRDDDDPGARRYR